MTTDVMESSETVLFTAGEVLIDSQASVNVFNSKHLLRNIRKCRSPIVLNGVQSGAPGVAIDMEGDFNELGPVFYSEGSSAKILSLGQLVDSGGDVRYETEHDHFTLRPKTSNSLYTFLATIFAVLKVASTSANYLQWSTLATFLPTTPTISLLSKPWMRT
jgi:hypothetical protein